MAASGEVCDGSPGNGIGADVIVELHDLVWAAWGLKDRAEHQAACVNRPEDIMAVDVAPVLVTTRIGPVIEDLLYGAVDLASGDVSGLLERALP